MTCHILSLSNCKQKFLGHNKLTKVWDEVQHHRNLLAEGFKRGTSANYAMAVVKFPRRLLGNNFLLHHRLWKLWKQKYFSWWWNSTWHSDYLYSPSLPGSHRPFTYWTTRPGSVDRNVVIGNSPQQSRRIPGHSGGERQPYGEPSERTGYGRGVLVQHQPGEMYLCVSDCICDMKVYP